MTYEKETSIWPYALIILESGLFKLVWLCHFLLGLHLFCLDLFLSVV